MTGYGQFCPVAKAMEVLDERWTMLVLRELMAGSSRFNDLQRGVPKMSPALLSKRLRSLTRSGLVAHGADGSYTLTPCGADLLNVVTGIGVWGLRWFSELGEEDLDPHLLMWDMSRTVGNRPWPAGRTVVAFCFTDLERPVRDWWFVVRDGDVDVCDFDPGHEPDARVTTTLPVMVRVWRGDTRWAGALRARSLRIEGPAEVRRRLPDWFGRSTLADVAVAS